jgi:hypothetical protein
LHEGRDEGHHQEGKGRHTFMKKRGKGSARKEKSAWRELEGLIWAWPKMWRRFGFL